MWGAVGLSGGLAFGLGLGGGRIARAVIGGLLGSVLAAIIYEIAGAVAFPLDRTIQPIAEAASPRLIAHLAVALCVSAGTLWAAYHLSLRGSPSRAKG